MPETTDRGGGGGTEEEERRLRGTSEWNWRRTTRTREELEEELEEDLLRELEEQEGNSGGVGGKWRGIELL